MDHSDAGHARVHTTTSAYVKIALFLAAVTAAEFGIVYLPSLKSIMAPLLLGLSLVKFIMVAAFFMHLRFDNKIFTWFFASGAFLATFVAISLKLLMRHSM